MRKLYYYPLCSASKIAMFILSEKKLDYIVEFTKFWDANSGLCDLNSFGRLPVLIDLNGSTISGIYAIFEYLEEKYEELSLLSQDSLERAEARRIFQWVNEDFSIEITNVLAFEKGMKRYFVQGQSSAPSSSVIKQIKEISDKYIKQVEWFIDRRNWLAGDTFSIADVSVAANFSILDYFGNVHWHSYPIAKEWYARVKSRPGFRKILADRVPGIPSSSHYSILDF